MCGAKVLCSFHFSDFRKLSARSQRNRGFSLSGVFIANEIWSFARGPGYKSMIRVTWITLLLPSFVQVTTWMRFSFLHTCDFLAEILFSLAYLIGQARAHDTPCNLACFFHLLPQNSAFARSEQDPGIGVHRCAGRNFFCEVWVSKGIYRVYL